MASLEINNVKKQFGTTEVLKSIDIGIEKGDFLVLVGPSGCGKSTLLNLIAGLETVSEGDIVIGGRRVNDVHPSQRDIAMVFQSYALYPNMNVKRNIAFGLEMRNVPTAERERAISEVAKLLQIDHLLKRKPGQLSGGQRQRVAMGRALVRKPALFLFDEPLSNLDAKLRVDMRTEIKRLHQRLGATIVYVTHDQIEAMTLATQIAVMNGGEIQQLGTPQQVYDQPANLFVAGFMGSPSMNLVPAQIRATTDSHRLTAAVVGTNGTELCLPLDSAVAADDYRDREVILGIRPEAITDPDSADAGALVYIGDCPVEVTEPTGADTYAVTSLGGREIVARMRANTPLTLGQSAPFAFNMSKAVLFDKDSGSRIDTAGGKS